METTKKFYQSKTVIWQVIAVICLWLSVSWVVDIDEGTQTEIVNAVLSVVWILSQIYSLYWRIVATSKIG